MFDTRKLVMGLSLGLVVAGVLLLSFGDGGVFNRVVPTWSPLYLTSSEEQHSPSAETVYHPEGAYIDLTQPGSLWGLILLGLGGMGLVCGYARKEWG